MTEQNRFPIYRSIRIRFAAIIGAIAALAIAIVALIFSSQFSESLTSSIRDELIKDAETSASAVGDRIQIYANRYTSYFNPHLGKAQSELLGHFKTFLENEPDFLMIAVYEFDAKSGRILKETTSKLDLPQRRSPLFFGKDPETIFRRIRGADRSAAEKFIKKVVSRESDNDFQFTSTARQVGVPIFSVFGNQKSSARNSNGILTSATVWMTGIMAALPKASGIESVLVDELGTAVGSAILDDVSSGKNYRPFGITQFAFGEKGGSGFYQRTFRPEFYGKFPEEIRRHLPDLKQYEYPFKGEGDWVGAYARVQRPDLGMMSHTVLVQKKADYVFGVLHRSLRDTFLVALFVILGAAAIGAIWAAESTAQLKHVYHATGEIASGNFSVQIPSGVHDEIGQIAHSVNFMAQELKSQVDLKAEKGRLQAEADTARTVQETFFPEGAIQTEHLQIVGGYQPATECGGDLWGHFTIRPGVELIYIADAMGHGASAAIMTAMAYTSCNLISDFIKNQEQIAESPAELLRKMNSVMYGAVKGKISVTCFVVVYDFHKREMIYANAGHNFPFLCFRKNGSNAQTDVSSQSLMASGNPLGVAGESEYSDKRRPIIPGERLILFTDGLIECRNPAGQMWGRKALSLAVRAAGSFESVDEVRNAIGGRAFSFFDNTPIDDDVTLVVAEVKRGVIAADGTTEFDNTASEDSLSLDLRVS